MAQEKSYYVEADWIDEGSGYRCVVLRHRENLMHRERGGEGHRCGYVRVPLDHPLSKVGYSAGIEALGHTEYDWRKEEGKPWASPDEKLRVHGGITFSRGEVDYPVENPEQMWWFGFDAAHYLDDEDGGRSLDYMKGECVVLAHQLKVVAVRAAQLKTDQGGQHVPGIHQDQ